MKDMDRLTNATAQRLAIIGTEGKGVQLETGAVMRLEVSINSSAVA